MSLHPQPIAPIPAETARVARAAFPKGTTFIQMRDRFGAIYDDAQFADLFPTRGQPAEAPWRLALICLMQFAEGLSDRQAAAAARARIDWKYALSLELTDPGFDFSVLCEFRARLLAGGREAQLLDTLLALFKAQGWLKERGQQRTDSTHVLAAIRILNKLETVAETLRAALNTLAVVAPAWLQDMAPAEWYERYSVRIEEHRLPKGTAARHAYVTTVALDGFQLMTAIYAASAPAYLRQIPAVQVLRQVWIQQFVVIEGQVRLRTAEELPPAGVLIESPYDAEAHFAIKRTTTWTGFKVHLTETCDPAAAHLITHVETTPAPVQDSTQTEPIQEALAAKALPPAVHFLDAGYVDAAVLVSSQRDQGIEIVGPVRPDVSWQAAAQQGYDTGSFAIDWAGQRVTCPQGKVSSSWTPHEDEFGNAVIGVRFRKADCRDCPARGLCTKAAEGPRHLTLRTQAEYEILQAIRARQNTAAWKARYNCRAGIEGTLSQGIRAYELRRTRYIGLARTHLQHILTAVAINVVRMVAWLQGVKQAKTRISRFAALAPAA